MRKSKKGRIEAAGWGIGDTSGFLGLSPEEIAFVEVKLALADYLKALRHKMGWTQTHAAKLLHSSQSRLAKMEVADPSVSLDLLLRALLQLGATRKDVARIIGQRAA